MKETMSEVCGDGVESRLQVLSVGTSMELTSRARVTWWWGSLCHSPTCEPLSLGLRFALTSLAQQMSDLLCEFAGLVSKPVMLWVGSAPGDRLVIRPFLRLPAHLVLATQQRMASA